MAIVTMKKLSLLALQSDKESIFDALIRTKSVEIKRSADIEACTRSDVAFSREKYAEKAARAEESIAYVAEQTANYNLAIKRNKAGQTDTPKLVAFNPVPLAIDHLARKHNKTGQIEMPKNGMLKPFTEVGFDYFLSFGGKVGQIESELSRVAELRAKIAENDSLLAQKRAEASRLALLAKLPHPTTRYQSTETSVISLMQLNASELDKLNAFAEGFDLVEMSLIDVVDGVALLAVAAHRSQIEFFEHAAAFGLVKCGVTCDVLPKVALEDLDRQIQGLQAQNADCVKEIASYASNTAEWKIYIDYLSLLDAKLSAEGDLVATDSTFVLEAYCPAECEQKIASAISGVSENVILIFDEIGEDEFAPTLIKSNKAVKPFEGVTNMYSPPAYHEVDPNPVMSVFYFIIFGFMVADIGYGALLLIAGLAATFAIKQQTGVKTLLQLFGICGLSAIVVGALFGSVFCYPVYEGIIPPPDEYPMVMMMISLLLGVIHISAGLGCKMAVKIKHKQILGAWLSDFPWIVVFASLVVAIFNAAMDMAAYEPWANVRLPEIVSNIALYVCLGALAVGVICAGLGQKGILNKAKSSFGSAYGIINYFSDIMSYIRVFGLMLSGALVGSVFNDLGAMVVGDGGFGYVLAGLLLVFLHLFNLAMSVLSVYIHNGRLQYVEFFGKFYEGDGELFKPFGSATKYTLITDE